MGTRHVLVAAVTASLALGPASVWAKDPPVAKPLRASLDVDADEVEDAHGLEERVNTALGARLRKAEVLPRKSLQDGLIHVELRPLPGGGYHYDVYAEQADSRLEDTVTSGDCAGCTEDALVQQVAVAVDNCLGPLALAQASERPAPEPPPAEVTPTPAEEDDRGASRPGAGPLGKTGIALMVAGAATAVVGVIFVVQGRTYDTRPGALEQEGVDFRPPGFGLLAGGGVALITGAILFGVDRKRRRDVTASAALLDGGAAVSVGGRF